jgi:hypothetical protein
MIHSHRSSFIVICIWIILLLVTYEMLNAIFLLLSKQNVTYIIAYVRNNSFEYVNNSAEYTVENNSLPDTTMSNVIPSSGVRKSYVL